MDLLFELTISIKAPAIIRKKYFPSYGNCRRYCHQLDSCMSQLNGYTVRRMKLDQDSGAFRYDCVLHHVSHQNPLKTT